MIHVQQCTCENQEDGCDICEGTGSFEVRRCPVSFVREAGVRRIIPHFFAWRNHGVFPDGRGRLEQPAKLLEAFELMALRCSHIEEQQQKNRKNGGC